MREVRTCRPPDAAWITAAARRWDVVPVVVQDPVWEQSFPDVAGVVLPLWDPDAQRMRATYLTQRECAERRTENECRFGAMVDSFARLALDPILLSHDDDESIFRAFHDWAEARRDELAGASPDGQHSERPGVEQ